MKDLIPITIFHGGPLQIACTKTEPCGIDVVTKLITHGADVDAKDSGDRLLYVVAFNDDRFNNTLLNYCWIVANWELIALIGEVEITCFMPIHWKLASF